MEIEKFITDFANQFDDIDFSEIKEDTVFQELEEWSSLTILSIIAMVKIEYGKELTAREIRSCQTVTDLFQLISSK